MSAVVNVIAPERWAALALNLAATLTSAWYCFAFGQSMGGAWIGTLAAVNGGVMASLLTSALLDWLGGAWRRATGRRR